jgi:phosphomethylpyrimidine synthase
MKITQDVRDYAAKKGVEDLDQILEKGMDEMSKEFREKGGEIYNKL